MTSIVLMCILYSGLASCVRAFLCCPGTGTRLKHAIRTQQRRGSSVRTFGLPQGWGNNIDDVIGVSTFPNLGAYPAVTRALERLSRDLPAATVTFPFLKTYVNRPLLEEKIRQVYNECYSGSYGAYTVIVGPDGAGKKFALGHVLEMKPGVINCYVTDSDTRYSLLRKILETSGEKVGENFLLDVSVLHPLLVDIAKKEDGRPLTIVFQVLSEPPESVLNMVGSVAKDLALAANVIVLLWDVNDVPMFDFDPRQKFLWVDGMTREEATVYAKTLYPAVADHDLELFFDKVGTLPKQIARFASVLKHDPKSAAEHIQNVVYSAESDLYDFDRVPILKALKASPDGVPAWKFRGIEDKEVDLAVPKDVAKYMRWSKGIVYHPISGEYRLATRAHRTALLELWRKG